MSQKVLTICTSEMQMQISTLVKNLFILNPVTEIPFVPKSGVSISNQISSSINTNKPDFVFLQLDFAQEGISGFSPGFFKGEIGQSTTFFVFSSTDSIVTPDVSNVIGFKTSDSASDIIQKFTSAIQDSANRLGTEYDDPFPVFGAAATDSVFANILQSVKQSYSNDFVFRTAISPNGNQAVNQSVTQVSDYINTTGVDIILLEYNYGVPNGNPTFDSAFFNRFPDVRFMLFYGGDNAVINNTDVNNLPENVLAILNKSNMAELSAQNLYRIATNSDGAIGRLRTEDHFVTAVGDDDPVSHAEIPDDDHPDAVGNHVEPVQPDPVVQGGLVPLTASSGTGNASGTLYNDIPSVGNVSSGAGDVGGQGDGDGTDAPA